MIDYFASDVHVSARRPHVAARFLRFLDRVKDDGDRLFLVGDIFDFWVGPKQRRLGYVKPILSRLHDLKEAGVEVTYIAGNRDFNFRQNGSPVPDELTVESAGRRVYLSHGDLLCTADRNYRNARSILRGRPILAALALMPLGLSTFLSEGYRRLSQRIVARKPRREKAIDFAGVRRHLIAGHDVVVCGHVHRAARYEVSLPGGRTGEFITLGDWQRVGVYLVARNGRLCLRTFP